MPKTIEYINKIKAARPEMPIIIGGTHASVMPEDTLQYCDLVVRKEGDETLPEVLEVWNNGGDLSKTLGISYWDKGIVKNNPDRPFVQEFETTPTLN